jgi:hypothetical protein
MPDRNHDDPARTQGQPDLADLMETRVEPAIKRVVRQRMRATLFADDEHTENEDALELVSEIRAVTFRALSRSLNGGGSNIDNVVSYATRIAANVCNQYFRDKYPQYFRIKNQVRYVLTHDARFALWKIADGTWLCGENKWTGRNDAESATGLADRLRERAGPSALSPETFKLLDLVVISVGQLNRPVAFSRLVSAIYEVLGIDESSEEFSDSHPARASEANILDRVEQKEMLETIWREMVSLPVRHRAALLLNLRNERSESVIELIPLMRIATIRQIAEALEIPAETFAGIWNELPWDDNRIAEHLGINRQQVINLRQSARARLRRALGF